MFSSRSRRTSRPHSFASFADGGHLQVLAAVDIAAGEHPFSVPGIDRPAHEDQLPVVDRDDRSDRNLGVEIEDEAAIRADESLWFVRLEEALLERAAAHRAEPVLRIVMVMLFCHVVLRRNVPYNRARCPSSRSREWDILFFARAPSRSSQQR